MFDCSAVRRPSKLALWRVACGVLGGARLAQPPNRHRSTARFATLHRTETLPIIGPHLKRARLAAEEAAEKSARLAAASTGALAANVGTMVGLSKGARWALSDASAADAAADATAFAAAAQGGDNAAKQGGDGPLNGGTVAAASPGEDAPAAAASSSPPPRPSVRLPSLPAGGGASAKKVVPLAYAPEPDAVV